MNPQPSFLELLLGTTNYPLYAVEWIFALVGLIIHTRLQIKKRDPLSPCTPFHFSWKFFWRDNLGKLFTSVLLIFVFLRFPEKLVSLIGLGDTTGEGTASAIFLALAIGFLNDKLAEALKKINFLGLGDTSARKTLTDEKCADRPPADSNSQ